MRNVGLTGGIGSGKTTVAHVFQRFGVPIYFSDDRAKSLIHNDNGLKLTISESFNLELLQDGGLDKKGLANIVFNDKEALQHLNELVHPRVALDYEKWVGALDKSVVYNIKEAAILYESGADKQMDEVILVTAPKDIRIARVMSRDGVEAEAVLSRMANQWSEDKKKKLCDHIINNDGEHSILIQIFRLHQRLLK